MSIYIQLVYLGHVEMMLANGALQLASVDITNGPLDDAVLGLDGSSRSQFGGQKYTDN